MFRFQRCRLPSDQDIINVDTMCDNLLVWLSFEAQEQAMKRCYQQGLRRAEDRTGSPRRRKLSHQS